MKLKERVERILQIIRPNDHPNRELMYRPDYCTGEKYDLYETILMMYLRIWPDEELPE